MKKHLRRNLIGPTSRIIQYTFGIMLVLFLMSLILEEFSFGLISTRINIDNFLIITIGFGVMTILTLIEGTVKRITSKFSYMWESWVDSTGKTIGGRRKSVGNLIKVNVIAFGKLIIYTSVYNRGIL